MSGWLMLARKIFPKTFWPRPYRKTRKSEPRGSSSLKTAGFISPPMSLCARYWLHYLGVAAGEIHFVSGPHGKPALAPPLAAGGLEFNLSHSHEVALVAVARQRAVGVDVEFVKRQFSFDELARRFFTTKEVAALCELPQTLQREAFFKCWTSKEAFLKAKGTGLSGKLDEVVITLAADQQVRINASVPDWSLTELTLCVGYQGALVIQGDPRPIRCYQWELAAYSYPPIIIWECRAGQGRFGDGVRPTVLPVERR